MEGFITDWLNLALRWFHVIVAIAWIGESFYFVALDNSLKPPTDPNQRKRGVFGEPVARARRRLLQHAEVHRRAA